MLLSLKRHHVFIPNGVASLSVCPSISTQLLNSSGPPAHSHFKKLTQLVISFPADMQHINILTLHLPEDDYKAYLSITGR